eukprot:gnl/Spiro4/17534_TR9339_c0_g1_i1.p1 gnl/Spiro4/17534_TR9339_c0_g1~~gnl/Spiro4/17534_TR9339_c0_g1_i1.p1  ORF type:complete len:651 (-),score=204.75 gnl/Spiro4/17534_TR9339_c0_g1_i1:50-1834(-)
MFFERVQRMLERNEFASDDEYYGFLESVFVETSTQEQNLACDVYCSKVLEQLINYSPAVTLEPFATVLISEHVWPHVLVDTYGSHVAEALMRRLALLLVEDSNNDVARRLLEQVVDAVLRNVGSALPDTYGSHVLRCLLSALSGIALDPTPQTNTRAAPWQQSQPAHTFAPQRLTEASVPHGKLLRRVCTAILSEAVAASAQVPVAEPTTQDTPTVPPQVLCAHAVPLFALLLRCTAPWKNLFASVLVWMLPGSKRGSECWAAPQSISSLINHRVGSVLVEALLESVPPSMHAQIYTDCFRGKLGALVENEVSSFVVQRLIHSSTLVQVRMIFEEIEPFFETFLHKRRGGVLWKLAEACSHHQTYQKEFISALEKALHVAPSLLAAHGQAGGKKQKKKAKKQKKNQPQEEADPAATAPTTGGGSTEGLIPPLLQFDSASVSVLGAHIARTLFTFQPQVVETLCASVVSLPVDKLLMLMRHNNGSKVVEAFLESPGAPPFIGPLIEKLTGKIAMLCLDKYASHCVEKAYPLAPVAQKRLIASELAEEEASLAASPYGRFSLRVCRVAEFKLKQTAWTERETKNKKKLDLFADILN